MSIVQVHWQQSKAFLPEMMTYLDTASLKWDSSVSLLDIRGRCQEHVGYVLTGVFKSQEVPARIGGDP